MFEELTPLVRSYVRARSVQVNDTRSELSERNEGEMQIKTLVVQMKASQMLACRTKSAKDLF